MREAARGRGGVRGDPQGGSTLRFRTGAGIVADSDPLHELAETRAKARGLLKALGSEAQSADP